MFLCFLWTQTPRELVFRVHKLSELSEFPLRGVGDLGSQQLSTIKDNYFIDVLCFRLIHYRGAQARNVIRDISSSPKHPKTPPKIPQNIIASKFYTSNLYNKTPQISVTKRFKSSQHGWGNTTNFTLRAYFSVTNFTLRVYFSVTNFTLRVNFICTIQKKVVTLQRILERVIYGINYFQTQSV